MMNEAIPCPTEGQIEEFLRAMRPLPSDRFHLRMQTAPWAGPLPPPARINRSLRRSIAVLGLIVALVWLIFSPQGRAFTQQVLRFFTNAESESFQVPEEMIAAVTAWSQANSATRAAAIPTDDPRTLAPYSEQISEIEAQVGFDLKEFPDTPPGTEFHAAASSHRPEMPPEIAGIYYESPFGGRLDLTQGLGDFPEDCRWERVPSRAIQSVMVGDYPGEFVQGYFIMLAGDTEATWQDDPGVQRLRWREGNQWFEIAQMNWPGNPGYLTKDELIHLAQSLVWSR